jgi:6-methylsalicylate decarboxylase
VTPYSPPLDVHYDRPTTSDARGAPVSDVHQHLWTDEFLAALSRRAEAPRLLREGGLWRLEARGEAPCIVDPAAHDPMRRALEARADGLDRVIVAPSCPIGVEALPADEAAPLVDAYHAGVRALGPPFRAWAAAALDAPDPAALAHHLSDGFVGLCIPAGALGSPDDIARIAPLVEVLEARSAPLLVHPGPAPWAPVAELPRNAPAWWAPLTVYVAQMQRAWYVATRWLRDDFPELRVCFAMLAGLAPLQDRRLRTRGGSGFVPDGRTFLETSSYGQDVIDAVAGVVGESAIVFGSDRPVVETAPVAAASARRTRANAARLIDGEESR